MCSRTPVARASSRQRAIASCSATGGRERAWASGSPPLPAALLGRDPGADDLVVLGVHAGQPAGRGDRGERGSSWPSGIRGKRCGWVSKVESLNAAAPASTSACTCSIGPRGGTVAHSATSTCASRSTSATLAANASSESIGPAAS